VYLPDSSSFVVEAISSRDTWANICKLSH